MGTIILKKVAKEGLKNYYFTVFVDEKIHTSVAKLLHVAPAGDCFLLFLIFFLCISLPVSGCEICWFSNTILE